MRRVLRLMEKRIGMYINGKGRAWQGRGVTVASVSGHASPWRRESADDFNTLSYLLGQFLGIGNLMRPVVNGDGELGIVGMRQRIIVITPSELDVFGNYRLDVGGGPLLPMVTVIRGYAVCVKDLGCDVCPVEAGAGQLRQGHVVGACVSWG
jgi:hypothetical protein